MKRLILVILVLLIALTALIFAGTVAAVSDKAADVAKEKAPKLEKIEFIHWKKGFARPPCDNDGVCDPGENPSCPDCKNIGDDEPPTAACYAFMGKYGKTYLKLGQVESCVINPTNSRLELEFIKGVVFSGAEEWDNNTAAELFNNVPLIDSTVVFDKQDYINAITWGDYPLLGVIAATKVWYNPATKNIVEFDIIFDTDYDWGDASSNEELMDLQNIATHELGHGAGLADVYEDQCDQVTMYGYSQEGDTEKRTLEGPDITGIQTLYGPR